MAQRPPYRNVSSRLPKHLERRRRLGILVKLWLFVAGFYRRANMYEDTNGAIEEARKIVENIESEAKGNLGSMDKASWGAGKSVEELWADIWAEVSKKKSAVY